MRDELIQGKLPTGYGLGGHKFVAVRCTSRKCGWKGRRIFRYTVWGKAKVYFSTILSQWKELWLSNKRLYFTWLRTPKYSGCFPYCRSCPKCHTPIDPVL